MSTRHQAARSMVWTVLESFGITGLSALGLVVVARLITPEQMGIAAMAQSIVQILNAVVEFLFTDGLIRRKDIEELHFDTAHTFSAFMGVTMSALCWIFSGPFSRLIGVPQMGPVLAWMGLSMAAMGFGTVIEARQRRQMDFKKLAIRSFWGRLIGITAGITVAFYGGGVWSLVAQQVLLVASGTIVLWISCRPLPSFRFSWPHFSELARFGSNTVGVVILNFSIQRLFMLLVGTTFSTAAAGYLNLAFRTVDILRDIVTNAASQLALPIFSRHNDNLPDLKRIYSNAVQLTCIATFPLFSGLAICADDFIHVIYGSQWHTSSFYVTVLCLLTLIHFSRLYSNSMMTALGYPHYPLISNFASLVAMLIGMLTIGRFSLEAAILVWAMRLLVNVPIDMWCLKRVSHIGYREQMHGTLKPFLLCCAMMLLMAFEQYGLMPNLTAVPRLITIVFSGGIFFLLLMTTFDRARLNELWHFAMAGLRRRKEQKLS